MTRRVLLARIARVATAPIALLALIATGHRLQKRSERSYPVAHEQYGESSIPEELADSIATAGQGRTWDPDWSTRLIRPPGALDEQEFLAALV